MSRRQEGLSLWAASGLPVYRHAPDAIWETSLVEWGTREAFLRDPAAWWQGYLDRAYESFRTGRSANRAHDGLARLAAAVPGVKLVTQNVDGLHDGCPAEQLVEVHGRLDLLKCVAEGCQYARHRSIPLRGGRVDQSYVQDPPRCPGCGARVMTQFLCFDEQYESHERYQWPKVLDWLDTASVFVFVGTSFAVGITEEALHQAERRLVPCFQFNINIPAKLRNRPSLSMQHVIGESDQTVAEFASQVLAGVAQASEPVHKRRRTGESQAAEAATDRPLPTRFGSLSLVEWPRNSELRELLIGLVRKCAQHDWTYPLAVIEDCVPGSVYTNQDCTLVVTTSQCGFYCVIGEVATAQGCADVAELLGADTGWEFLYSYPAATWDAALAAALACFRFERSCFNPPACAPLLATMRPLPTGMTVERVTTALLKKYQAVYPWHRSTWPDPARFGAKGGVGYLVLNKKQRVAAGCIGVFIGAGTHELDIFTAPRSRGKGLAQIAACHTMCELMHSSSQQANISEVEPHHAKMPIVSWACDSENAASRRIAEKLGFTYVCNVACFRHSSMNDPKYDYAQKQV